MNLNLKIKWMMLLPFRVFKKSKLIRRFVFSFGNPISCPSVTINTKIVGKKPFREDMASNIDWGTWADFMKKDGEFLYLTKYLTFHRVHEKSETSNCINNNKRLEEDYQMFCRFWPKPIAKFIMFFYKNAVKAN